MSKGTMIGLALVVILGAVAAYMWFFSGGSREADGVDKNAPVVVPKPDPSVAKPPPPDQRPAPAGGAVPPR
jgi:flagellar basal body-associated protein FliL